MLTARNKRVAEECIAKGIPFMVLAANDAHAQEALVQYIHEIDADDDVDSNYVRAVSSDLQRWEDWRNEHPEDVGPPVILEGEN